MTRALPATVADCIRRNGTEAATRERPFVKFEDTVISHAEFLRESSRFARLFLDLRVPDEPFHVGVLLDNLPEYLFALGGAALAGAVLVGINNVQRGEFLARDIRHTDCRLLLTEPQYLTMLAPIVASLGVRPERVLVSRRREPAPGASDRRVEEAPALGRDLDLTLAEIERRLGPRTATDPGLPIDPDAPSILVFTSGTTGAPKAVQISQRRMISTGEMIGGLMQVGPGDVGYLAMPLFHANSQQCGFMPALLHGGAVGLVRRFSRSRWLDDVRRYGVTYFNYTGKPLSYILTTPRRADDARNPLRVAYGNEGSTKILAEFSERFGCKVIDGFGATEGGFGFSRQPTDPAGSVGMPPPEIRILDEEGRERPRARLDAQGRILNPDEAIGEIVNTAGTGKFEGYYKNPAATAERSRGGMYWSGDFGFKDEAGYVYFTGRDISWIRVDGENFLAKPIEDILQRHPDVYLAAVYAVPDVETGDRVMATIVMAEDARFDPAEFYRFLESQSDMSPKWRPTYLRLARDLPQTATNKILKRELAREKFRLDRIHDAVFWCERGESRYKPLTAADHERLLARFTASGRAGLLDI
ncbi:MAG TPA: AMP-binding protein [Candidatus Bathyarchaeia archaeon]|nr:AMP-binding protein [Candidatus Bathyarchaeia archaeon]